MRAWVGLVIKAALGDVFLWAYVHRLPQEGQMLRDVSTMP